MILAAHVKDDEWLKLVLQGICPECVNNPNTPKRRLFKKGIKRYCLTGHLTIYGNPIFLAYKLRSTKKDKPKTITGCPKCGGQAVTYDRKHDELICDGCHLVLSHPS